MSENQIEQIDICLKENNKNGKKCFFLSVALARRIVWIHWKRKILINLHVDICCLLFNAMIRLNRMNCQMFRVIKTLAKLFLVFSPFHVNRKSESNNYKDMIYSEDWLLIDVFVWLSVRRNNVLFVFFFCTQKPIFYFTLYIITRVYVRVLISICFISCKFALFICLNAFSRWTKFVTVLNFCFISRCRWVLNMFGPKNKFTFAYNWLRDFFSPKQFDDKFPDTF